MRSIVNWTHKVVIKFNYKFRVLYVCFVHDLLYRIDLG